MASKLIRHELKNTWLEITIVCASIIFFSLVFGIAINNDIKSSGLLALAIVMLGFSYIAAFVLVIINIVRSINTKIFSNEGYLTLTLPVSIDQLLFAKILVNFIWIFLTYMTLFISIGIIGSTIFGLDIFEGITEILREQPLYLLIIVFSLALESLVFILTLILVLSFLNTGRIKKYKLLVGVVFYYLVVQILSWIKALFVIIPYVLVDNGMGGLEIIKRKDLFLSPVLSTFTGLDFNNLLINVIVIIGFYFLARYIIKTKIELE